jgi:hypothetical protein
MSTICRQESKELESANRQVQMDFTPARFVSEMTVTLEGVMDHNQQNINEINLFVTFEPLFGEQIEKVQDVEIGEETTFNVGGRRLLSNMRMEVPILPGDDQFIRITDYKMCANTALPVYSKTLNRSTASIKQRFSNILN